MSWAAAAFIGSCSSPYSIRIVGDFDMCQVIYTKDNGCDNVLNVQFFGGSLAAVRAEA